MMRINKHKKKEAEGYREEMQFVNFGYYTHIRRRRRRSNKQKIIKYLKASSSSSSSEILPPYKYIFYLRFLFPAPQNLSARGRLLF